MESEQITNTEDLNTPTTPQVKKQKDPKKVKAGKALAKINAEARNLVRQDEEISSQEDPIGVSTIYNGILSMAGLVGAGFTLYHGWKFFETKKVEKLPSITPKKSLRKTIDF